MTALNEPYAVFRLAAACAVITFARCIWPITIPGGNPEKAPTLVPISPLILVMPSLLKAPVEVKTLNLDAELKSITCVKLRIGRKDKSKDAVNDKIFIFI